LSKRRRRGESARPRRRRPEIIRASPSDFVPDQRGDVGAAEIFHRADAGRQGDVNLDEEAADHVDAD
jgi:hypothetical protein